MSKRGREGERIWRERGPVLADEISDQIAAEASERMDGWVKRGRVPWWVRAKARRQGRRIEAHGGGGAR